MMSASLASSALQIFSSVGSFAPLSVPGAALVLLEHLHLDPGQIGELRLRQAGSLAELFAAPRFL